ncbi:MAG: hypothetical protein KatS3mg023_0477 [Armatimonadota bacterium]|nr:MAG: hypothetical protein KatS3mg023_0477 [Armatimonadota bacterium]
MLTYHDILKQIDPLANDEVSQEFLRIAGADPQLMRELAMQQIAQQFPFVANVPSVAGTPFTPPAQPNTAPNPAKPTYMQQFEQQMQQMPAYTPPPAPQPIPAPPAFTPPPPPKLFGLPPLPSVPEPGKQWSWSDFIPALVAAATNQDALPAIASGIEQALQTREQRAMNRYERAMQNALREWQAKAQAEQMNTQLQNAYQQQAYESQLQHQQNVYQTQAANIQQQNQYAQQRWASEQEYKQWEWGQKLGILGRLADREMQAEERELQRQLQAEMKNNQFALNAFNTILGYASKPQLTATERQSALQLADVLAQQFPTWAALFEGMKASIKVKPSVPEQNLDIQRQKAQAAILQANERIKQGWARVRQGEARLRMAQDKASAGNAKEALQQLKAMNSDIGKLEDDIKSLRGQLYAKDNVTLNFVINDPAERERITRDMNRMIAERDRLITARDALSRQILFSQTPAQPKPAPQPKQQRPKPQAPTVGTTPSGTRWRVVK